MADHHILFGLLLIAFGLFAFFRPEDVIFWDDGWRFRYAEPSSWYVWVVQIQGVVAVLAGVGLLLGLWSGDGWSGWLHIF